MKITHLNKMFQFVLIVVHIKTLYKKKIVEKLISTSYGYFV